MRREWPLDWCYNHPCRSLQNIWFSHIFPGMKIREDTIGKFEKIENNQSLWVQFVQSFRVIDTPLQTIGFTEFYRYFGKFKCVPQPHAKLRYNSRIVRPKLPHYWKFQENWVNFTFKRFLQGVLNFKFSTEKTFYLH